jgi:hypothetical protein
MGLAWHGVKIEPPSRQDTKIMNFTAEGTEERGDDSFAFAPRFSAKPQRTPRSILPWRLGDLAFQFINIPHLK